MLVLIKLTNQCLLNCSHCYIPACKRENPLILSPDLLLKITDFIQQVSLISHTQEIQLIITGGEPLLLDCSYLSEIFELIQQQLYNIKHIKKIYLSLQSSLIPLQDNHIALIKKYFYYTLHSSLDFSQRKLQNNRESYFEEWVLKKTFAEKNGIHIVPVTTPTKPDILQAFKIYQWLQRQQIHAIKLSTFIPAPHHAAISENLSITNQEQSQFLIDFFTCVMQDIESKERTPIFCDTIAHEILRAIQPTDNQLHEKGCQSNTWVFEPNGDVGTCPHSVYTAPIGTITENWKTLFYSSQRQHHIVLQKYQLNTHSRCLNCEFFPQCKRGCIIISNDNLDDDCRGFKNFLIYIKNYCSISENHRTRVLYYARSYFK